MAMTLKLAHLVDLLERLERCKYDRVITTNRNTNPEYGVIREWFRVYDQRISRSGPAAVALLSCLFPERLTQRTYNIREQSLSHIIPRILAWGSSRARTLRGWKATSTEFALLVETEMSRTENASPKSPRAVTVEQADAALFQLAANSHYSAPAIRGANNGREVEDVLTPIFSRLKAREAKWFVRLILKDLRVIQVPERIAFECFHFLLPDLLSVISDFAGAIDFLGQQTIKGWPINPSLFEAKRLKHEAAKIFQPTPGTMIPRTAYDKARSLKHAVNLARSRTMSVERKYDGEYCQIHIQRGHDHDTIQIFSKSGKDSTMDRESLHGAITAGLDLAGQNCKIKTRCVLEGELVVWSRCQQAIQPFYKLRNHVKHGGRRLGRANDGPRDPQEQLMIVFYDLLVFDEEVKLTTPHAARRRHLKGLVKTIPGVSMLVERELVDCDHQGRPRACTEKLRQLFAQAITNRWEGLVLKGRDDPYLSFVSNPRGIKLKKDYLAQLGDVLDLCIIGGRLDPTISNPGKLKWNTFYLGCLLNKEACQRFGELPSFAILDSFCDGTGAIPKQDLEHLNATGIFCEVDYEPEISEFKTTMLMQGDAPTVLYRTPFIVECLGAGFDKNSDCAFWTLRFPRLARVHHDRSLIETISFAALQEVAEQAQISPVETDDEEVQRWVQRLVQVEGKSSIEREALASQSTASVPRTPHSATTASLSPVAARNRPPSLPVAWKQVHARSTSISKADARENTQQTTTTSTGTPSTARTWPSPDSLPFADLPVISESAPAAAQQGFNGQDSTSPASIVPTSNKRRRSEGGAVHRTIKRPRLVGGRTILETPTPAAELIDLTQSSPNFSPTRSARPVEEPTAYTPSCRLGFRSVDPNDRPGPLPLVAPRPSGHDPANSSRKRTSSTRSVESDGRTYHARKRSSINGSVERRPLAELPSDSPSQRAPPVSIHADSGSLDQVKEKSLDKIRVDEPQQGPRLKHAPEAFMHVDSASTLPTRPSTEEAAWGKDVESKATPLRGTAPIAASSATVPSAKPSQSGTTLRPTVESIPSPSRRSLAKSHAPGPMSHKARLATARASVAAVEDSLRSSPSTNTRSSTALARSTRPRLTIAPSSPVLAPTITPTRTTPGARSNPNPIIFLTPSALAALHKDSASVAADQLTAGTTANRKSSAATALLAKRSVTDDQVNFVARLVEHISSHRQQTSRAPKEPVQRFVMLANACAEPKVVAEEIRGLMKEIVRTLTRPDGDDDLRAETNEFNEDEHDGPGPVPQTNKPAVAVLDYKVVEWLKTRKRMAARATRTGEAAAGARRRTEAERAATDEPENEHFVCAIHVVGGGGKDSEGWMARVVWRS